MAMSFEDEFDYLEDEEFSDADDNFAPTIKGAVKPSLNPVEEEEAKEKVEEKPVEEEKPSREFNSSIFIVKVTTNKEDKALEMVADKVKKKDIGIYAIARPHGLRGYIFLEAPDRKLAEDAVYNLPYVKGIIGNTVEYKDVKQMLEPVASEIKIEKNDIIEIIGEPFKGEKAKVVRIDKTKNECVVSLLAATVPIPVSVKLDNIRVIRRDELEEEQ